MSDKKRIVLADASEEFRQMLADMMEQEADLSVVAQTASGDELLELIARHKPDVVVMDLMLSGLDGLGVLEQLGAFAHSTDRCFRLYLCQPCFCFGDSFPACGISVLYLFRLCADHYDHRISSFPCVWESSQAVHI